MRIDGEALVAVVRDEHRLTAVISRQTAEATYENVERDLASISGSLFPQRDALVAAFERLQKRRGLLPSSLRDLVTLALFSLPRANTRLPPRPVSSLAERSAARATAAHPRGYRGTKEQPPKRPAPDALAFEHLSSPSYLRDCLANLWKYRDSLDPPRLGWDPAATSRLFGLREPPLDPFFVYWFRGAAPTDRLGRTAQRPWAIWCLREATQRQLQTCIGWIDELLRDDETLCAAVARLLAIGRCTSLPWIERMLRERTTRREILVDAVLEHGVPPLSRPLGRALEALESAPDSRYATWLATLLRAPADRADYLNAGFRLAIQFDSKEAVEADHARGPSHERIESLILRLPDDWDLGLWAMRVWRAAGQHPDFLERVEPLAERFSGDVLGYVLWVVWPLLNPDFSDDARQSKWKILRSQLVAWAELLDSLPSSKRQSAAEIMTDVWETLTDGELLELGPRTLKGAERLAKAISREWLGILLCCFVRLPPNAWTSFIEAPASSYRALASACARRNDALLLGWGVWPLCEKHPGFFARCFVSHPRKLLRAAKLVGSLSYEARVALVSEFSKHALMRADIAELPAEDLVAAIKGQRALALQNVVPRALREHVEGKRRLSASQLARHKAKILGRFDLLLLTELSLLARDHLRGRMRIDPTTPDVLHALRLLRGMFKNRRALRKFLDAEVEGRHDYLEQHPATLAWFARHPRIDRRVWTTGITLESRDGTMVGFERNPWEILRLGTYVGSCFGLGGSFSDSAAAVLLDANKRVVYARSASGQVLARQILAVTADDRLVAFSVYPQGTPARLLARFAEFDERLARALGIELVDDARPDYDIESILSQYFWDDGAWREAGEARSGTRPKRGLPV